MVFKVYTQRVRYPLPGSGIADVELDGLVRSFFRTPSALIIRMNDERILTYPPNATILPANPADFDLTFVAPGASFPPDVQALRTPGGTLRPDYVIP
jgi:hypothetical protein